MLTPSNGPAAGRPACRATPLATGAASAPAPAPARGRSAPIGPAGRPAPGASPGWFAAVGVPGNLLALVGMVWLGVAALRRRTLPIWAGVLAILAGLLAVALSEYGTSALAGAFWLYAGARLARLGPGA